MNKETGNKIIDTVAWILMAVLVLLCVFSLSSCTTTRYVPVEKETVRTEYKNNTVHDSVFSRDSIFVLMKGDTVYKDRIRTIYKERFVHDTILKVDTVSISKEIPVYIEKKTSFAKRVMVSLGAIFLFLISVILVTSCVRFIKK